MVKFDYDAYHRAVQLREECLDGFFCGEGYVPILIHDVGSMYEDCRNAEEALAAQLLAISNTLKCPGEWIPYLEPWCGVGIYANAYGTEYVWPEDGSPWTFPVISNVDEARGIERPSIEKSPIMQMALDTISYFVGQTKGEIPICLTDTQSPIDSATLIWDPTDLFVSCYTHPDIVHDFMETLTDLVIEFSSVQLDAIGSNTAQPGHIMLSSRNLKGIALSDDMLAVLSPRMYEEFGLRYNSQIGEVFGGVAIHSCGRFEHNIQHLLGTTNLKMVDLALSGAVDPQPNRAEAIRDAFIGTGIIVKVRVGNDADEILQLLQGLDHQSLKYCVEIAFHEDRVKLQTTYDIVRRWLEKRGRR
jgi:uroporphyrinogen-III decarboxylase